jgi:hypothetical protein
MTMKSRSGKPAYDKSLRPVRQPGQMGDWAAIIAVTLSVGLWMLWPSAPAQIQEFPQLPEPTCTYGKLSPNSSAGNVLARFSDGPAGEDTDNVFARLPVADTPPIPPATPAPAAVVPPPAYEAGARWNAQQAELPPTPDFPFSRPIAAMTGLVVQVSEQLRSAGFSFDPPAASTNAPFSLSASLAFDGEGHVELLAIDNFTSANVNVTPWRYALGISRTTTNATGTVKITQW